MNQAKIGSVPKAKKGYNPKRRTIVNDIANKAKASAGLKKRFQSGQIESNFAMRPGHTRDANSNLIVRTGTIRR